MSRSSEELPCFFKFLLPRLNRFFQLEPDDVTLAALDADVTAVPVDLRLLRLFFLITASQQT